ncbi:hypothetical protein [Planococcus sp. YIM B11945]|uniref:hypothetical protein n=1 Tax=Planococcus sp. YIM B11945 TaxID=3435410 RepID=UPI003D7E04BF
MSDQLEEVRRLYPEAAVTKYRPGEDEMRSSEVIISMNGESLTVFMGQLCQITTTKSQIIRALAAESCGRDSAVLLVERRWPEYNFHLASAFICIQKFLLIDLIF